MDDFELCFSIHIHNSHILFNIPITDRNKSKYQNITKNNLNLKYLSFTPIIIPSLDMRK